MPPSRKRKHPSATPKQATYTAVDPIDAHAALFIQAHEADVVRGPQAGVTARSLEVVGGKDKRVGDGLVRWGSGDAGGGARRGRDMDVGVRVYDDDDDDFGGDEGGKEEELWIDRHDARLLLDTLPTAHPYRDGGSPTGWSDLPSDAEDMFFFAPDEIEDYRRDKRRRLLHESREKRLRAIRAEEEGDAGVDVAGGSDEEPDDAQRELMEKTAVHILSSPNPALLEMRILANHGGDKRFGFLKGRWARRWKLIGAGVREEKRKVSGLSELAGYESDELE